MDQFIFGLSLATLEILLNSSIQTTLNIAFIALLLKLAASFLASVH